MKKLAAILVLLAAPAAGQFRDFVFSINVSQLPTACTPQHIYNVRDGATATDCSTGGGSTAVWCICDAGGASYTGIDPAAAGGGTDDQTAVEVPYTPTTGTDWADPDPTEVLSGLDDLAGRLTIEEAAADGHGDGANCVAGSYPLGVDASGAVQSCTDASTETDSIVATHAAISGVHHTLFAPTAGVATDHGAKSVAVADLADGTDGELITWSATGVAATVAVGSSGEVLTSNGIGAAPTFQAAAGGGIGGSSGATDNAIIRADGVGGSTVQSSALGVADTTGLLYAIGDDAGEGLLLDFSDAGADDAFEFSDTIPAGTGFHIVGSTDVNLYVGGAFGMNVDPGTINTAAAGRFGWSGDSDTRIDSPAGDQIRIVTGDQVGLDCTETGGTVTCSFDDIMSGGSQSTTLGAAATTFAVTTNLVVMTGDAGANTVATITGASTGMVLTLLFVDGLITITDTDAHTANTVDLSAAFTSADDTVLTLIYDGTSWYEKGRSVN